MVFSWREMHAAPAVMGNREGAASHEGADSREVPTAEKRRQPLQERRQSGKRSVFAAARPADVSQRRIPETRRHPDPAPYCFRASGAGVMRRYGRTVL